MTKDTMSKERHEKGLNVQGQMPRTHEERDYVEGQMSKDNMKK